MMMITLTIKTALSMLDELAVGSIEVDIGAVMSDGPEQAASLIPLFSGLMSLDNNHYRDLDSKWRQDSEWHRKHICTQ